MEYAELRERYPPNPNIPYRALAARLGIIVEGEECVTSEPNRAAATGRPAANAAEKLKPASPNLMTDAELLEQLLLAANHNVVPGQGIEDVGRVRVMLESGIKLDDVLCTLSCEVDRRLDAHGNGPGCAHWNGPTLLRWVVAGL